MYTWREECGTGFNQCGSIRVKTSNGNLRIIAVYRSPNLAKANDDELCEFLVRLNGTYAIFGDFNFPDIRWQTGCAGTKGRKFMETVSDKFMTQNVEVATHNSGNTLDLILSSEDDLVRDVETCGKMGKSDHDMITCKVQTDVMRGGSAKIGQNFRRAKREEMRKFMDRDWRALTDGKTVNEIWSLLKKSLETAMEDFAPLRKIRRTDEPKWLDAEVQNKIGEKRRAWSEWRRTGRETERAVYRMKERESKHIFM